MYTLKRYITQTCYKWRLRLITQNFPGSIQREFSDGVETNTPYERNNPKSCHTVPCNYEANRGQQLISSIVGLRRFSDIYLTGDTLSHFTAIRPRGLATMIKKVPCNGDYGATLYHNTTTRHDHIDVSRKMRLALF